MLFWCVCGHEAWRLSITDHHGTALTVKHLLSKAVYFVPLPFPGTIKLRLQILTHGGGSLLRVVAQWLVVWASGSVHSSGTGVRCRPFPLSQIYRATCYNTEWSFQVYKLKTRRETNWCFILNLECFLSSFKGKYDYCVLTTKLQRANKRDGGDDDIEAEIESCWVLLYPSLTSSEVWFLF